MAEIRPERHGGAKAEGNAVLVVFLLPAITLSLISCPSKPILGVVCVVVETEKKIGFNVARLWWWWHGVRGGCIN
jgi:hypothetical protein